ncbi:MAG: restriction endonuclease subunit S, partial [Mycoplasmatales bacterium]
MAIYKLGDICVISTGNKNKEDATGNGPYPFYTRSVNILRSSDYTIDEECVIIPGEGIFKPMYNVGKAAVHQRVYIIRGLDNHILNKYLFYWWLSNDHILYNYAVGSTVKSLRKNSFESPIIDLPKINVQQEIIDIIKPIEDSILNIQKQISNIKKILIANYEINSNCKVMFNETFKLSNKKYNNQIKYLATNAIGELSIDISKAPDISSKRPSRANLTPEKNSIIFSKLDGENKIFYVDEKFDFVVSTGFINITTDFNDHVVGYILSDDFKKQKTLLSTGTTMVGLNNDSLNKMVIKKPLSKSNDLVIVLNQLLKIELKLKSELN